MDNDDELATEGGDKAAVAKLNTGGFVVMFKCGDEILEDKDIQVNGGDFITPPKGYRFTGESEKYYYTPITEKTWVTVAEAEEGVQTGHRRKGARGGRDAGHHRISGS